MHNYFIWKEKKTNQIVNLTITAVTLHNKKTKQKWMVIVSNQERNKSPNGQEINKNVSTDTHTQSYKLW